ncbi:MAG TPA: type II toxin-antitoxin system ParD family antitoxin [Brevundimonas sp.]|jgi:antitoxin ParD1/3/4|uniref:type II toxin-antitoxin system ParD family antitoxin n=1 Tax=Brevundimonas sp. TaxID=1871086 RepID=UPI002D0956AB|nr:type II toxin-antitoxin system ParD family antitoxin [Brevundimonas sp.]HRH20806.1 type II toxin-antitoxin system ParD family antitoxin [Brevundimonas sp.]
MTMTVELGTLEAVVERLVKEGRYGSKSEVLRAGVRLVEEHETRLAELRAKLQEGIDDLEAGRFVTLDELEAEFAERRRKRDAA